MRIISNNKTTNSSDYLQRKKNIINYNNVITEQANTLNSKTTNFKINNNKEIIQYKSYDLFNNINQIKNNFDPQCWELPKKTMTLSNGKISIYDCSHGDITNNCDIYSIFNYENSDNNNNINENCIEKYSTINNIPYDPDSDINPNPNTDSNTIMFYSNFTNLDLMLNGTYKLTDLSYASWSDFTTNYTLTNPVTISYDQLLWNGTAFIANGDQFKIETPYNNFENSGNKIFTQNIESYWNLTIFFIENTDFYLPKVTKNYKFITLKINVFDNFYESNILLISIHKYINNNNYSKLELGEDFMMYMCEENSYYDVSNSGHIGYSGWLNASILFDGISFINAVQDGQGCYNNLDHYYTNKEILDYELYIPLLNTRSTTAIYIKIGLPIDTSNNIGKIEYRLPSTI